MHLLIFSWHKRCVQKGSPQLLDLCLSICMGLDPFVLSAEEGQHSECWARCTGRLRASRRWTCTLDKPCFFLPAFFGLFFLPSPSQTTIPNHQSVMAHLTHSSSSLSSLIPLWVCKSFAIISADLELLAACRQSGLSAPPARGLRGNEAFGGTETWEGGGEMSPHYKAHCY